MQKYASFHDEEFIYAIIHLSIFLVYFEINENGKAVISFNHRKRILREEIQDYWILKSPA